jgi:hypothetical protein
MAIFTISNFTRYNTNDLLALLEVVEKRVVKHIGGASPTSIITWKPDAEKIPTVVILKTYTPGSVWETYTNYNNGKKEQSKTRLYVKSSGHVGSNEVRILDPAKMWDSPPEALAAAEAGTIPKGAVIALARRFYKLYQGGDGISKETDRLPSIRIENKQQKKVDSEERRRSAHSRAYKAWSSIDYPLGKVIYSFGLIEKTVERGLKVLRRAKVEPTPEQERLADSVRHLANALQHTKDCLADIAVQIRESQGQSNDTEQEEE